MDVTALRSRIQATLESNADTRRQAELDLKAAEDQPGFPDALLNILDTEESIGIRQSAAVYLKNRINKGWSYIDDHHSPSAIPENEKEAFRRRLVPTLTSSPPQVRAQLIPILNKILHYDFPEHWPDFFDVTQQLLTASDASHVFSGLQCLLAICKVYRYKAGDSRTDFDKIVAASFPQLLNISNQLVQETSLEAGEMLRIALKCYKQAIFFELAPHLREHQNMVGWCTLFLTVISKDPPENSMHEDLDERELNHWWKCKKWAYSNCNRLFVRYGNPTMLSKDNGAEYTEVAKSFIANFAPEILKNYLQQVEKWVAKTTWLSKPCLSFTLTFLDECVKPKSMWAHLKPHLEVLISHLVFPVLCQSDEDIELFETDPQEYLHRKLNFYEEVSAPDVAATNFLITLTKARKPYTYTVLNYVNKIVNEYESVPDDQRNPRQKEGALRMIGTLAPVILEKKSPIAGQVEYFFVRHVFPEFRSPHGFLRARACDTLEKFEALDFKDSNNLMIIYRNILESMADPELPVRVEAALALRELIRHDVIRTSMQQNIPQIMQQLLKLANEVDVDALANVMEDFVEVFAAELTPFAVALSEQLRDTYLRIVRELLERNSKNDDDDLGDFLDDKSITALGVLQTIGTLILTLESTPDVLQHLETILMPIITITLENQLYDLYNEVFEMIDSCTFSAKAISPTMWHAFELVHQTFKAGAELYLEDMLPALENFVNYGGEVLVTNKAYLDALVDMARTMFKDEKVGGVDRICGCKLAEILMLTLRGHMDTYVPELIQLAVASIANQTQVKVKSLKIHLYEVIINAIYYNPSLALQVLEADQWTNKFFSLWFSNIDSFSRVHDKKLSIVAISSLLTLRAEEVPQSVQTGWPRLLQGVTRLFQTLPAAMKHREEALREDDYPLSSGAGDDDQWDDEETAEDWTADPGADESGPEIKDESSAYLEFLNSEAEKFSAMASAGEEDELEEEGLLETPLDRVEPYSLFKACLVKLQQEQPQLYDGLMAGLNDEDKGIVRAVCDQADALQAQASQQLQQAHLAAMQAQPGVNGQPNGAQ